MDYMARLRCKYFVAKWKDGRITKTILRGVKMMENIEKFQKKKRFLQLRKGGLGKFCNTRTSQTSPKVVQSGKYARKNSAML